MLLLKSNVRFLLKIMKVWNKLFLKRRLVLYLFFYFVVRGRAGFRTSAALGLFKYAAPTPRKKNVVIISNNHNFIKIQNLPP